MRRWISLLVLALTLLVTPAVGGAQFWDRLTNPQVAVTLRHPPGLGLRVSRIAFGPARGAESQQFVDALVQDLVASGIEVVDRQNVEALMAERKLTLAGYVDREGAASLGKALGPAALVFVNVSRAATEQSRVFEDYRDGQDRVHRRYISRTQAFFKASVQTVDLSTGRIFQATMLEFSPKEERKTVDQCCAEYPPAYTVLDDAMRQAVASVHRLFAPWDETTRLYFFDDKECGLRTAYAMLKAGDFDGVMKQSAANLEACKATPGVKAKTLAHAHYNLGMAHLLRDDHDRALEAFAESQRAQPSDIAARASVDARQAKALAEAMRRLDERVTLAAAGAGGAAAGRGVAGAAVRTAARTMARSAAPGAARLGPADRAAEGAAEGAAAPEAVSIEGRLRKLDGLYARKLITKLEYEQKRAELIGKLD